MRVCCYCTLVWLACLSVTHGGEEGGGGRRWLATSDGPYRVVVSSETLEGEESVSLAVAQKKKDKEVRSDERTKRRKDVRRRRPEILPRDSIIPFFDFGKKLSTRANTIETTPREETRRRHTIHTTPREEPRRRNVTRLLPVSTTSAKPTEAQKDLQPNESAIKLQAVLSPNYGLRLNKTEIPSALERATRRPLRLPTSTSPTNITENPVTTVPARQTTESRPTVAKEETSERPLREKTDLPTLAASIGSLKPNTNISQTSPNGSVYAETMALSKNVSVRLARVKADPSVPVETSSKPLDELPVPEKSQESAETEAIYPKADIYGQKNSNKDETQSVSVATPKPTARILSTAVVTSVSVKESPWIPRHDSNKPEPFQRLAMKIGGDNATSLTKGRARSEETPVILSQNFRRKMYTTLRPKTTTYKPVTFRSVFRRNFTGLGAGVVHVHATPSTYIEVPKILNNSPTRYAGSSILSSVSRLSSISSVVNNSYSSTPAPSPSTVPLPQSASTTVLTSTTTTTEYPADLTTVVRTNSSVPTTTFSSPTLGNVYIASTVPTSSAEVVSTTTARSPSWATHVDYTTPELASTEISTQAENAVSSTSAGSPMESSSVEIEFKPLDENASSTTGPPKNRSMPTRGPHLTWIYNRTNHSVFKTQAVNVAYSDSHLGLITYVLAGLAVIPLVLGLSVLAKKILKKSKKKVLDESEYSSEYNRTPLPTKLPRVPPQIKWEGEKAATEPPPQITPTKWEFSREKLRLQTVLGQGNFGQVWKAEADDLSGHEGSTRLVAVKTVKEGSSQREKEDLLRELGIMQELGAHPNVVTLLGCCTEKEPYLLIMEYVMYGKLLAFLREHRTRAHYFNFSDLSSALTSRDLTFFSYCVARGMEYLVSKGIIHRDLAARNILVDHTKLCKIADFGMSRNVRDTGQIYEQRPNRGALPIRWMAPESLHLNLFTHKSDVWSFGILMWEIITLGSTPYNKMGGREVMREVRAGYRLEKPKTCRPDFYKVIRKCWENDPSERPSFSELKTELSALLGDPLTNGEYVDLEALTEEMSPDQAT